MERYIGYLKGKSGKGLDVRVLYDGAGCLETLPLNYDSKLGEYGIKSRVFNPMIRSCPQAEQQGPS